MISKTQLTLFALLFSAAALFPLKTGTLLLTNSPLHGSAGDLIIMDLESGRMDTLVRAVDSMTPYGPCFSPDGRKVAYMIYNKGTAGNRIRVIDLFTRVITGVGPDIPVRFVPLSWAGNYIYCTYGWSRSLQKVNIETGVIDTVFTFQALFDQRYWTDPNCTPGVWGQGNVSSDGTRGAYVLTRAINNVFTFDLATGREVNHSIGLKATCQAAMSPSGEWMVCTNHGIDIIQACNDSINAYRTIFGYTFWFNRWSYNSNDDLTFYNAKDSGFYSYNLVSQECEFLLKGLCVWNWDVRGWVLDTIAPAAPTGLTGSPTDNAIRLSWSAPASGVQPTGYIVERNGVRVGTSSTTTFTDNNLTASTTYSYSIYSRTAGVKFSSPLTGNLSTTADQTPPKITGAYAYGTTVDLIFSEPLNAASVTNVSNYTFTPSLSVVSAVLTAPKRVRLTTANTNSIANSVISVSGVKDVSLNTTAGATDSLSIVSNLWVSTGRACKWATIDSGTLYWTDDTYPEAAMPLKSPAYGDLPFLQTSVGDGTVSATADYMKFNLNRRMVVMIIGSLTPSWCNADNGWINTGLKIGEWAVSTKVFEPGQVTLKGTGGAQWTTFVVGFQNADSSLLTARENRKPLQAGLSPLSLSPSPVSGGRMSVSYHLSGAGQVRLAVFNTQGKLINMLVNEKQNAGTHRIAFKGLDTRQTALTNGVYFCRLIIDNQLVKTERFVIVR